MKITSLEECVRDASYSRDRRAPSCAPRIPLGKDVGGFQRYMWGDL